jgi:multiple sugar transport system ATP-binding protein
MESGTVQLEGVSKTYPGNERAAVAGVDLDVEAGDFFSMLGPSGCGKTTTLRIIAGFEYPDEGRVYIGGRDVTALSPRDRDIAMVFQDYALYPHMTVGKNIGFNLSNRKVPRREVARRVEEIGDKLGIDHLLRKKPAQLSGGERQRVALGRALVRQPRVFLLDEPLSNLDLKLREAMRIELGRLHQELGITTIYVTHDQAEAMTLSTRLAVMESGRVQQVGAPDEIYARPANTFVARFIGSPSMNVFRMQRVASLLRAKGGGDGVLPLPPDVDVESGKDLLVGVRPHDLRVVDEGPGIPVAVAFTEHLGRNNFVVCEPIGASTYLVGQDAIQVETPPNVTYEPGTRLLLSAPPESIRVFEVDGAAIRRAVRSESGHAGEAEAAASGRR